MQVAAQSVVQQQPTWLIILQAASYIAATVAVVFGVLALWLAGIRYHTVAYTDKDGVVIVDISNPGRSGGFVAECYVIEGRPIRPFVRGLTMSMRCARNSRTDNLLRWSQAGA